MTGKVDRDKAYIQVVSDVLWVKCLEFKVHKVHKQGLENFDVKIYIFHPSSVQYVGEFIFFVCNLFNDDVNLLGYSVSSAIV